MADAESPASLFELLYIFFPHLPMRIGYDNACHFLAYALNRDPEWAAMLRVFIDRFHSVNHTACARSFDASALLARLKLLECKATAFGRRSPFCMHCVFTFASLDTQALGLQQHAEVTTHHETNQSACAVLHADDH